MPDTGKRSVAPGSELQAWHLLEQLDSRAASKISRDDAGGCWTWIGARGPEGYGYLTRRSIARRAHRYIYELLVCPIPEGLQIDHLCRVRCCVNPEHLEPVTPVENTRRGEGHGHETHCPQGHPYSGANLGQWVGRRYCRTCNRARAKAWRASNRLGVG